MERQDEEGVQILAHEILEKIKKLRIRKRGNRVETQMTNQEIKRTYNWIFKRGFLKP